MHRYVIFTIPNCPKCLENKKLLDQKGIKYTELDVISNQENIAKARAYEVFMAGTVVDELTGDHINVEEL